MNQKSAKTATTVGTLSSLIAASTGQAAIQAGTPVSISGNDSTFWSIDGGSTTDFQLSVSHTSSEATFARFQLIGAGGRFAATSGGNMAPLTNGAVIDSLYNFRQYASGYSAFGSGFNEYNMSVINNGDTARIGFKFTRNGGADTHYGVADFQYILNDAPGSQEATLNISNVLWNDVPGQGITGAGTAVPEPETVAFGLGALALGAAGLRRWRKSKAA